MSGPLSGYKIVEFAGIGPGPFCAMLLSDMGAEVIRVERAQNVRGPAPATPHPEFNLRGRRNVALDLKNPDGLEACLTLIDGADAIIEGFRPGVMERLGMGPEVCLARNPKLVYGRMTGWGQEGPYAMAAGHDINYIALAGALAHIGREGERPLPPLNLVGDFGGGGMFLAYGLVCALLEAQKSGTGQVVDTAMIDGTAMLMSFFWGYANMGVHDPVHKGVSTLDTGAHFYEVYETKDGKYVSIGAIEPQFYLELIKLTGVADDPDFAPDKQRDTSTWRPNKERFAEIFKQKTREEWCEILEYTDACFAPVLTMHEAAQHPHNVERQVFRESYGSMQPSPAPRFSRTPGAISHPPAYAGQHTKEVLTDWGIDNVDALIASGAAKQA